MGPEDLPIIVFTDREENVGCATFTIVGDRLLEEDEVFSVMFAPVHPLDQLLGPSVAEITIEDNDGIKIFDTFSINSKHSTHIHTLTHSYYSWIGRASHVPNRRR